MSNIIFWITIGFFNLAKFIRLDSSPPAFYADEAAGAAQVMCLKQNGADYYGHSYPLFTYAPVGGGYYTAPYLYGQMLWTGIFGNSIYSFRAFVALVSTATLYFLYEWIRKRASARAALFAVLFASISPWAFQFARIAWDPPIAPFFLMLGLWCFDLKNKKAWILGTLAFTLAAYAYPPSRIQVVVLFLFLPSLNLKQKLKSFALFTVGCIPMALRAFSDPAFTARGKMLAITSDYSMNPYREAGIFGLIGGFIVQFSAHLTPDFLFIHGDHSLRHSTQAVGELSWPEGMVLTLSLLLWIYTGLRNKKIGWNYFFIFCLIGIATGIAPAALTWESIPHALRAIGAWPFFAAIAGLSADYLLKNLAHLPTKWAQKLAACFQYGILAACILFGAFFMKVYFVDYPVYSLAWFESDKTELSRAYDKMIDFSVFCSDIRPGK